MKTVLIVDDEKSFLLSLKDGLSINNDQFQVLTAENGLAAVEILQAEAIDLLVTDLRLPKMDGFELLAWISRQQPQLPVIVMTAYSTPEIEARLARLNTLQFLEKPLDLGVLQEGINIGLNSGPKSYIRGISLATFLQLMRLEQKSCTLKISAGSQVGYLYIKAGELLDAVFADLNGEAAALEIVGWEHAEIEMDGICHRQEPVIDSSIEHLLIEAFRRKDEKAQHFVSATESGSKEPAGRQSAQKQRQIVAKVNGGKRLAGILSQHPAVQEFVVFNSWETVVAQSRQCSPLEQFDPAFYRQLIESISNQLPSGSLNFMTLSTTSRISCLLFSSQGYQVLAKLKTGIQPQRVAMEMKKLLQS